MSDPQLDPLLLHEPTAPEKCRLFLAIFPDEQAADLICRLQDRLHVEQGRAGKPRPRNDLHVTLHFIGDCLGIPESQIAKVGEICDLHIADEPAFDVTFDHAESFDTHRRDKPLVLTNPGGNTPLRELHGRLVPHLEKPGSAPNFNPHVTLLYHPQVVRRLKVEPVTWRVREVVLVLSHHGRTKYDKLASWSLKG